MPRRNSPATLCIAATLLMSTACSAQDFVYRLDPEPGVRYKGAMTMETRSQTRTQGMDIEIIMTVHMDHDVVFEAVADDTVAMRYTTTAASAEMGGMPGLDQAPFDLNDLYQGMVGVTFTMVMTRDGEIVEFDGLDSMMETMLDRMDAPDQIRAMTSLFLEENFGEEQMKQMIGQDGLSMPDHPVAIGDTWTNSVSALGIEFGTTYTLADRSDGSATIEAAGTLSDSDNAGFNLPGTPNMPGVEMQFENLSGALESSYELDEATGLTVAYSTNMTMNTDMVMEMPQVDGQSINAPSMSMSISTETTTSGTLSRAP